MTKRIFQSICFVALSVFLASMTLFLGVLVQFLHSEQTLPDGTVLQLALSPDSVWMLVSGMVQPICFIFAIAVALSVFLAVRISKSLVRPLNEIDLDAPLSNRGYDELLPLLGRIASQQSQLRRQETELRQKQDELDMIIGSMHEGMILLNQKGKIISINPAAERILKTGITHREVDIQNRNPQLWEIIARALQREQVTQIVEWQGARYRTDANPLVSGGFVMGAAVFLFPVTEREKAEQMRREFTANVSHELKTPLHAISGYAELLRNDMVKREDIAPFAGRIYQEAQRMIRLVADIVSLSRLDEGAGDMQFETVDLRELAEKVLWDPEAEAAAAHVSMELHAETAAVRGVAPLLYAILHNLCDNAIKYNRQNGNVIIYIGEEDNSAFLSVQDTGIGIAAGHHDRIFERFYRVDKSRSKEAGGTGLGLSIVKHAAKIHGAEITVESAAGEGTTIRVTFPTNAVP